VSFVADLFVGRWIHLEKPFENLVSYGAVSLLGGYAFAGI
jgi:hypothetical protein